MINIHEKLRPFSHRPGISCLIPGTGIEVEIYPALIRFYDIQTGERRFLRSEEIPIQGPIKNFTIVQDCEKRIVTVFGKNLFYHIKSDLNLSFQKKVPTTEMIQEKLFFGIHKQQNWEAIIRRRDMREIFPLWFALGALLPNETNDLPFEGMFSLLEECKQIIVKHRPEYILPTFEKLFLAGFRGILVPRIQDDDYQGIMLEKPIISNPLLLLREGYRMIRSLFVETKKEDIFILPNLPPEFFAGSMTHITIPPYGTLSLEWSKKTIRRMTLQSTYEGRLNFIFSSSLKTFRLRNHKKERGQTLSCNTPLHLLPDLTYFFDRFEK